MDLVNGSLRIALLATARYPIAEPFTGGLAAHVATLARGLAARGHAVTVFAPPGTDAGPRVAVRAFGGPESALDFSAAARGDVSMLAPPFMAEHHAYQRLMLELTQDCPFDVVHNHGFHYLPIAMAPAVRAASVTTFHAPPTPWQESAVACLAPGEGPAFLTVSETNRRAWASRVPSVRAVRNGIDLSAWPVAGDARASGHAVWTGRMVPEKGPHLAVEAAHAAGFSVRLAGPTPDADYLHREVLPRLGADDELVGHVTQAELGALYGTSAVALSTPRWEEPFGLTTVEALACGVPVAAFDRGAMRELLCPRSGRLATPDDAWALGGAALDAAALDPADCRARAEAVASVDAMLDGTLAVYAEALAQHGRLPAAA